MSRCCLIIITYMVTRVLSRHHWDEIRLVNGIRIDIILVHALPLRRHLRRSLPVGCYLLRHMVTITLSPVGG